MVGFRVDYSLLAPSMERKTMRSPFRGLLHDPLVAPDYAETASTMIFNWLVSDRIDVQYLPAVLYEIGDSVQWCCRVMISQPQLGISQLDVMYRYVSFRIKDLTDFMEDRTTWYLFLGRHHDEQAAVEALEEASLDPGRNHIGTILFCHNSLAEVEELGLTARFGRALNAFDGLKKLSLFSCNLDLTECPILAELLGRPGSILEELDLSHNYIADEELNELIAALGRNRSLKIMNIDGNRGSISARGWNSLLDLVLGSKNIEGVSRSNNVLTFVGRDVTMVREYRNTNGDWNRHWEDADLANLLLMSLRLNGTLVNNSQKTKMKILWRHARGDMNLGQSNFDGHVSHKVLHHYCDNVQARKIMIQEPPNIDERAERMLTGIVAPSVAGLDAVRMDSVYRILRSKIGDIVGVMGRNMSMVNVTGCKRKWQGSGGGQQQQVRLA